MNNYTRRLFSAFIALVSLVSIVFAGLVPNWRLQFSGSGYGYYTYYNEPPTEIIASDGIYADKVEIFWSGVWNAVSYAVYRCTTPNEDSCAEPIGNSTSAPFYDTEATPGVSFYYRIKPVSITEYGDFSNYDVGHRAIDLNGIQPLIQASSDDIDEVLVSWNRVDIAATYDLWRSDMPAIESASKIADNIPEIMYADTSAIPGIIYTYWVLARNLVSESDYSDGATGIRLIDLAQDLPPQDITASDGEYPDKVAVSWSSLTGASSYTVLRSTGTDPVSAQEVGTVDDPDTNYDDSAATAGTRYNYWVKGSNAGSDSPVSASDSGYIEGCDFYVIKASNGNVVSFCL